MRNRVLLQCISKHSFHCPAGGVPCSSGFSRSGIEGLCSAALGDYRPLLVSSGFILHLMSHLKRVGVEHSIVS